MNNIISKEKIERLNYSFTIVFLILLITLFFIFIQIMKSDDYKIINLLSLECCVLFVASYFYYQFVKETDINNIEKFDYEKITLYRYFDWSLTTPILLLTFLLLIQYINNKKLYFWKYFVVFILNYVMLFFGYLGEAGKMDKMKGLFLGFIAYILMILFIFTNFIYQNKSDMIKYLFIIFVIVWASYGVIYLLKDELKNHLYNHQDIISKSLFSIFIWFYYYKVFTF
jgi:bacteriorhodopsin